MGISVVFLLLVVIGLNNQVTELNLMYILHTMQILWEKQVAEYTHGIMPDDKH